MDTTKLAADIKRWGAELGFQAVGIADCDLSSAEPRLLDSAPTFPGNADYRLGLAAGSSTTVLVAWGFQSIEPNAFVGALPWHLHVAGWNLFSLTGAPGRPGLATWRLPLPADPALATVPLYFQMFALDGAAPGGIASSRGYEFFVR